MRRWSIRGLCQLGPTMDSTQHGHWNSVVQSAGPSGSGPRDALLSLGYAAYPLEPGVRELLERFSHDMEAYLAVSDDPEVLHMGGKTCLALEERCQLPGGHVSKVMSELRHVAMSALHQWLGTPQHAAHCDTITSLLSSSPPSSLLHVNKYHKGPQASTCPCHNWHVDRGLLTVVWSTGPGLQAHRRDGTVHDVPCDGGATVAVFPGLTLAAVAGVDLPATRHRAVYTITERVSLAFKLQAHPDTAIPRNGSPSPHIKVEDLYNTLGGSIHAPVAERAPKGRKQQRTPPKQTDLRGWLLSPRGSSFPPATRAAAMQHPPQSQMASPATRTAPSISAPSTAVSAQHRSAACPPIVKSQRCDADVKPEPTLHAMGPVLGGAGTSEASTPTAGEGCPPPRRKRPKRDAQATMRQAAKVPSTERGDSLVTLTVVDQNGCITEFRLRRSTELGRVFDKYCETKFLVLSSVSFVKDVDGSRLHGNDTVEAAGLRDGDQIMVVVEQID